MSISLRRTLLALAALALPACSGTPTVGEAPPDFTLSTPTNGAIGISGPPTFTWADSPGTTTYTFQLSTDSGFGTLLVNETGIEATSLTPSVTLSPGTIYYWRVFAERPTGNVAADVSPWTFTTVAPTPGAFTLSSPVNGTMNASLTPAFSWTSSLGAASYRLQVSTDPAFGSLALEMAGIGTTSATSTITLSPSTNYFWKVVAESTNPVPATGSPWAFRTQEPAPGSFTMTSPATGATGVSNLPTFTWNPSVGATSYRLQVSKDFNFTTMAIDQSGITGTSFTVTTSLLPLTTYYWKVTAVNAGGSTTTATPAPLSFMTA